MGGKGTSCSRSLLIMKRPSNKQPTKLWWRWHDATRNSKMCNMMINLPLFLLFRGDCANHFASEWFVKFTPTTWCRVFALNHLLWMMCTQSVIITGYGVICTAVSVLCAKKDSICIKFLPRFNYKMAWLIIHARDACQWRTLWTHNVPLCGDILRWKTEWMSVRSTVHFRKYGYNVEGVGPKLKLIFTYFNKKKKSKIIKPQN